METAEVLSMERAIRRKFDRGEPLTQEDRRIIVRGQKRRGRHQRNAERLWRNPEGLGKLLDLYIETNGREKK